MFFGCILRDCIIYPLPPFSLCSGWWQVCVFGYATWTHVTAMCLISHSPIWHQNFQITGPIVLSWIFHFWSEKKGHLILEIIAAFQCFLWLAGSRTDLGIFLVNYDNVCGLACTYIKLYWHFSRMVQTRSLGTRS